MSQEQSDRENSVVETEEGPVDDGTAATEMNLHMPRGSGLGSELVPKNIPIVTGAVGAEADTPDPGQPLRLGLLGGAKPKWFTYEQPTQRTPGPGRSLPGAGTQPVTNRFTFEMPTLTHPGPGRPLPGTETQPVTDRFAYKLLTLPTSGLGRLPPRSRTQPWMIHRTCQIQGIGLISCYQRQNYMTHIGHQRPIWWTWWCTCNWRLRCWRVCSPGSRRQPRRPLHPPMCLSSVGWLVSTTVWRHCSVKWVGRCYGRPTTLVSLGGDALNVTLLVHILPPAQTTADKAFKMTYVWQFTFRWCHWLSCVLIWGPDNKN